MVWAGVGSGGVGGGGGVVVDDWLLLICCSSVKAAHRGTENTLVRTSLGLPLLFFLLLFSPQSYTR